MGLGVYKYQGNNLKSFPSLPTSHLLLPDNLFSFLYHSNSTTTLLNHGYVLRVYNISTLPPLDFLISTCFPSPMYLVILDTSFPHYSSYPLGTFSPSVIPPSSNHRAAHPPKLNLDA